VIRYSFAVIVSFKSKALSELWGKSRTAKIDARLHSRILRRLEALNVAMRAEDMDVPGFDFHSLRGFDPIRYTIHVNGPWCITFSFADGDAVGIDLEQYH
jgi:proteic killer suppression protein